MSKTYTHRDRVITHKEFGVFLKELVTGTIDYFERHLLFKEVSSITPNPLFVLHDDADIGTYCTFPGYSFVTDPRNHKYLSKGFTDIFENFQAAPGHNNLVTVTVHSVSDDTGRETVVKEMTKEAQVKYIYHVGRWLDLLKCVFILCSGLSIDGDDLELLSIDNHNDITGAGERRNIFLKHCNGTIDCREIAKELVIVTSYHEFAETGKKRITTVRKRILRGGLATAVILYLTDVLPFLSELRWAKYYQEGNRLQGRGSPNWNDFWCGAKVYCRTVDWEELIVGEVQLRLGMRMSVEDIKNMSVCFHGQNYSRLDSLEVGAGEFVFESEVVKHEEEAMMG